MNQNHHAERVVVRRSSAPAPLVHLALVATPVSLLTAYGFRDSWLAWPLAAAGTLPVLVGAWAFWHFARRDPDRLHSGPRR